MLNNSVSRCCFDLNLFTAVLSVLILIFVIIKLWFYCRSLIRS